MYSHSFFEIFYYFLPLLMRIHSHQSFEKTQPGTFKWYFRAWRFRWKEKNFFKLSIREKSKNPYKFNSNFYGVFSCCCNGNFSMLWRNKQVWYSFEVTHHVSKLFSWNCFLWEFWNDWIRYFNEIYLRK